LLAMAAAAQGQRGAIVGALRDASGAVLPGVTAEACSPSVVWVTSTVTDGQGNYRFPALPPGTSTVTATLQGFVAASAAEAIVTLAKQLSIELTMKLAGVTEAVVVTAESPIIDVKANAVTASVDSELIALIPKGRGLLSVLTQIPGTNTETRGGGLMIDGASGSENRFVVDGVDRTNARTGTATAITAVNNSGGTEVVVQDFIEEVQVKQSGWNAEYRAALGGVVNAVTKTGSNNFHGSAGMYYTNNDWLGDIRRELRSVPTDASKAEYIQRPRDKAHQSDAVVSLGGPIMKDKVWFFAGYAQADYPAERTVTWANPGTFPATQTFDNGAP